ncbi:MAG TPA: cyclic nucleotide-binding domain-containing protein [Candidatus Dormibacteraeota bacterium]
MRIEASVTAVSWIPREAVEGMYKMPFTLGLSHYDEPLPEALGDLDEWRERDLFREANHLKAYIEVEGGRIVSHGHLGRALLGSTTVKVGPKSVTVPGAALPLLQPEPEVGPDYVRFTQTAGGRTGVPAPRPVKRRPFFQFRSAIAWSTLELTLYADGRSEGKLIGASTFPRHWVYDNDGKLAATSGTIDSDTWFNDAFGAHTPWGSYDSETLVTPVESATENELMKKLTQAGADLKLQELKPGDVLMQQGEAGDSIYLLLDGVLAVHVDGEEVARVAPGAILGERAALEGGARTATLVSTTRSKVAELKPGDIESQQLAEIAGRHRREDG